MEVVLVTVHSKTEQADVAPEEIRQIILDLEAAGAPEQNADGSEQEELP